MWVGLCVAKFLESLQNLIFHGLLVDATNDFSNDLQCLSLDLNLRILLQNHQNPGEYGLLHRVVINLLDDAGDLGQGKELQLGDTALQGFIDQDQEILLEFLRPYKFHEELCILQDEKE